MTQTEQNPPPGAPPPPGPGGERQGWNTDHLTDYRRLRRSRVDRKVAGVAGGLGRHLDVDPTILRVLFVVLVFFGGAGLLLYAAFWLFVPEDETGAAAVRTSDATRNTVLLIVLAVTALLAIGDLAGGFGFPWPLAILAVVVAAVLVARDGGARAAGGTPPPPPPASGAGAPAFGDVTSIPASTGPGTETTTVLGPPSPPYAWTPGPPAASPPSPPRRSGPLLFGLTVALLALALGVLGLYDAAGSAVLDAAYPALALAVIGAMLVVGAFVGRPGGLIALGLIAGMVLLATAIGDPRFEGDRDQVFRPTSAADVADSYDVPAGRIVLDLTDVADPERLDGRDIELDANAGEIVVRLPEEVAVRFDAHVAYGGEVATPDEVRGGWDTELAGTLPGTSPVAQLELDVELGFGRIEVRQ